MSWSLSEIEGLTRKAARGAGFCWGLADEAGKAARWLASYGLPGPEVLADFLEAFDGTPHAEMRPHDVDAARWQAHCGTICPISAGTALCDLAQCDIPIRDICIIACAQPLLLLPFVSAAAEDGGQPLRLTWKGGDFSFVGDACGQTTAPLTACADVHVTHDRAEQPSLPPRQMRYDLDAACAGRLAAMAARTYAPDTEESRISGAGAGLTDND